MEMEEVSQVTLLSHYTEGRVSLQDVCDRLGIHRTTLWRKLQRLKKEGREGLVHKLKGRPSNNARPKAIQQAIRELWTENYSRTDMNITQFYQQVVRELAPTLSYSTVLRWLKK